MTDAARAITRTTCWSVRQCVERAAALLQASERVVAELDAMAAEIGMHVERSPASYTRCAEHQAIVTQLDHLHTLVEHCLANLRHGFAAPATPDPAPPRPASPPMPMARKPAKPEPAAAPAAETIGQFPPKPAPAPARTQTQARKDVLERIRAEAARDGLLDLPTLAQRTGLAVATLYQYRSAKLLPDPYTRRSGIPLWHESQVATFEVTRRHSRASSHQGNP